MRIKKHPILGEKTGDLIEIIVNGEKKYAFKGESVASALIANGVNVFHITRKNNEPRGFFCGIGLCTDCMMIVNGKRNTRTCITLVKEGMIIETQIDSEDILC